MYTSLIPIVGWTLLIGTFVFAWLKGAPAERWGASLKVFTSATAFAIHAIFQVETISVALLVADGLLAVGFLALALRYASLWLGAAMLLQGVQFSLHGYYLVMEHPHDYTYSLVNNINSFLVIGCIVAGTVVSWRRRTRLSR